MSSSSSSGHRVLTEAQVHRYGYHKPRLHAGSSDDPNWLDLTQLTATPTPCATFEQMLRENPDHIVPVALLGMDQSWLREQQHALRKRVPNAKERHRTIAGRIRKTQSFHRLTPSYLAGPFRTLVHGVFEKLALEDRNLAALVLPNLPVHYYAVLKGKFAWSLEPDVDTRAPAEFTEAFAVYFSQRFGRAPDLRGMHWEHACHARKLSLHVHVSTEAFASHADLQAFAKAFQTFLRARSSSIEASYVCRRVEEDGTFEELMDLSVYRIHSLILDPLERQLQARWKDSHPALLAGRRRSREVRHRADLARLAQLRASAVALRLS
jgi:hypothetical protein